jgi:hypothetical protein
MDKDHCQRITSSVAGAVLAIVVVAVMPTAFVYAQTTTTPEEEESTATTTATIAPSIELVTPSAAAQQIINNSKAECEAAHFFQPRCVELVYESPATVVVKGLVLLFGGSPESESQAFYSNSFLWKTVDAFKAQGYRITDIEVTVLGRTSTNSEFNVIMSK